MPFLREKNGRWSPEKIIAFAVAVAPALWLAGRVVLDDLGPRPLTEAIHFTGRWAVRLLLLSLAITPARWLLQGGKLILARRTLGVACCCYAVLHLLLFVAEQKYNLATVVTEIALRVYLLIGFVALVGLIGLAVTSTDAAIRRLGPRWNTLHQIAYVIGLLGIVHFMLQKKLDIYEPTLMAGLLLWLLGYRLWRRYGERVGAMQLVALTLASAILTAALESLWYMAMTGVNPLRVLEANLMFDVSIRPMWWVFTAGLAVTAAYLAAQWLWPRPAPRVRTARQTA
jgi:methionine sulfoxide reductase heme-binding subunit